MGRMIDLANIERRVSVAEFAFRMDISEKELYARIKDGRIKKPFKDGRKNFWLNSYVIQCVLMQQSNDGELEEAELDENATLPSDTSENEANPESQKDN